MRISHSHKFVFIAVARTGSTSVRSSLDELSEVHSKMKPQVDHSFPFYHHITAAELVPLFAERSWDWQEYRKFCVVRNPFDRAVSLYHHKLETGKRNARGKLPGYNQLRKLKYSFYNKSFKQWLLSDESQNHLTMSVEQYACDQEGNLLVDDFLRFEDLASDFSQLWASLQLPEASYRLEKKNASANRQGLADYFDDESEAVVRERYKFEIANFDYSLDR